MKIIAALVAATFLLSSLAGCEDSLPTATPDASLDGAAADGGADALVDGPAVDRAPQPEAGADGGGLDFAIDECLTKSDGTACGVDGTSICLAERCVTSSCGDGYIDLAASEECEDGNQTEGDGCTQCKFDCTQSEDCEDDQICNGSESCDVSNHVCMPGGPVGDGTICQQVGGAQGVCNGGVCVQPGCGNGVPDGSEQCDDGNKTNGDGCENDCSWTCETNKDCDDGDPCSGVETCDKSDPQKPICKPGAPKVCSSPSCAGSCDPLTGGCVFPDADKDNVGCNKDCDDKDPSVFPGAPECKDGKDNDCDKTTPDGAAGDCRCYVDNDSDGFAPGTTGSIVASPCPTKYTPTRPSLASNTDCLDSRADVKPGQSKWFAKPHCRKFDKGGLCISSSYDYDCSTVVELRYTAIHKSCKYSGGKCVGSGWGGAPPKCGDAGPYVTCSGFVLCVPKGSTRVQSCH